MPGERFWFTKKPGNSNDKSNISTSAWYDNDLQGQTGKASVPQGGVGTDNDMPSGGDTIVVDTELRISGVLSCGSSGSSAIWEPVQVQVNGGTKATRLPTGNYRVWVRTNSRGFGASHFGRSESAVFAVTKDVSKPRLILPPLPNGWIYEVGLTNTNGASETECVYCAEVTGTVLDLVSEKWFNRYAGVVVEGTDNSRAYQAPSFDWEGWSGGMANSYIPAVSAMYIDATDGGKLVINDGGLLILRGDFYIKSNDMVGDDVITCIGSGTYGFDKSLCSDPSKTEYREIFDPDTRVFFRE